MPLGWWTDLEVARRSGARITTRGDCTVVRTPGNPDYHWGNYVVVPAATEPDRARETFSTEFPGARHEAIGFLGRPQHEWPELQATEVRARREPPRAEPVPGYSLRALSGEDWRQACDQEAAELGNEHVDFVRRRSQSRQRMVAAGDAMFLGVFAEDELVAGAGIVLCGSVARYQSVTTQPEHRNQGLASWMLAHSGRWAQQRGARQWVILAEPESPAARLYDTLGFALVDHSFQVERVAAPEA